jgi:hypothetical protein
MRGDREKQIQTPAGCFFVFACIFLLSSLANSKEAPCKCKCTVAGKLEHKYLHSLMLRTPSRNNIEAKCALLWRNAIAYSAVFRVNILNLS